MFFFLGLLNSAEHLLENQEHLSAIRALAAVRLHTWKTFAQTAGAKSFSDWMSFSPKLYGICSLLSAPTSAALLLFSCNVCLRKSQDQIKSLRLLYRLGIRVQSEIK